MDSAFTSNWKVMMSRPILAILVVLIIFFAVIAYNGNAVSDRDIVHITYWTGWSGHELQVQRKLVKEFNRTHPKIHVRILSIGASGTTYQKVRIALATSAVPDVCSAVWSFELAGYARRGVLEPLDAYMQASGRSGNEFIPGIWRSLNYQGRLYALCATTNSAFIVYNKKVFRECGLDPNHPPRTIEELDKAVAAVTKYDNHGELVRYGFRPAELDNWAYAFGGKWYDPKTGRITANDPKNVECLRWIASYSKKYDINKMQTFEQSFGNNMSENASFFTGKQIFWITGEWIQQFTDRYAKDLEWGFFPLPCPPGGRAGFTPVGGSVFCIPSASRHKKEAWEFLSWICGDYAVKKFCLSVGNIPPLKAVAKEAEFQKNPLLKFATDLTGSNNAIGAVPIPIWPQYQQEIMRVQDYAVHGKEDPKKLLDDLTLKMQKELDTVMGGY